MAGLWPCLEGCSWALPPTQQLHTGSIEARTFLAACVTGEEGAGPLPQIRKAWLPQEEALDASQQGNQTNQSKRKSVLIIHWKN